MLAPTFFAFLLQFVCLLQTRRAGVINQQFQRKAGTLHQSPYSTAVVTCAEILCTKLQCVRTCAIVKGCVVISYCPTNGSCILSRRPDSDSGNYEVLNPAWNTYHRVCPTHKGYRLYDTHQPPLCLRLVTQRLDQENAKTVCWQEGADLIRVKTQDVYDIAKQILIDAGITLPVWAGAEDRDVEREFYWNDGTRLMQGTSVWLNPNEGYGSGEDCVSFSDRKKLFDAVCNTPIPFICQYDI